ncbi:hypothetical protein HH310_30735 [Actinoplanes sp. TBRC 11911]|uniref:hypothetical protein n=1 Tax=Actinoplanes sp. TBRC 11911 TaxID=2729386 RepID=UPI00145E891F|nr:hypothetical protein [Actinoplanes sp. TBRC 11911]NMO55549.1 hypothetical protein [Actinoplanes sp. TBRC 11911]
MTARITGPAAALLTLSIALTGCSVASDDTAAPAPAKKTVTPHDALFQSVPGDDAGAYKFEVTQPDQTSLSGYYDAAHRAFDMKISYREHDDDIDLTLTMNALVRDEGTWMKAAFKPANLPGLPKLPSKWMKLDTSRVKDAGSQGFITFNEDNADPGDVYFLAMHAATVTETGSGQFAGTTDITSVPTGDELLDEATLKALGAKAKTVPFTAVVDAQGHLTSMTLKIPAAGKSKAGTYTVKYSDYGKATVPAVPAPGAQTPAPDAAYDLLNS